MKIVNTPDEVKQIVRGWRREGKTVGLVPTMGFLHSGHASLIDASHASCDKTVVSIFVNPIQFGPKEDLATYPRDLEHDAEICEKHGADLIFHPDAADMYKEGFSTYVDMSVLTEELCGLSRPTHFRGVCTVVNKLFNIATPDKAFFGQKDAQQLAVIKHMVSDLNMNVEVVGCPIVRESDGLAMSSRNTYLSPEERKAALVLSKSVFLAKEMIEGGERDAKAVTDAMKELIGGEPLARNDYVKVVDGLTMQQVEVIKKPALAAIAVYVGKTRLIDNYMYE